MNWKKTANVDNYDPIVFEDSFLGSLGIKVGEYYAGKDDFVVLIPWFKTGFEFQSYDSNGELILEKTGDFITAFLDDAILTDPDYDNKYNSFCNQGFVENRVVNMLAPNNVKCLYISHSYGRPMTMYLSLNFRELRNLDPQEGRFSGDYLDYINEYDPDVVIIQTEYEGKIVGKYNTGEETD